MWRGDGEEEFIKRGEEREKRQVKKGWRCYEQKRTQVTLAGGTLKPELEPAVFYGLRELVLKFTSFSPCCSAGRQLRYAISGRCCRKQPIRGPLIALFHGRRTRLIQGKYRIPLARTQQIPLIHSRKLLWSVQVPMACKTLQKLKAVSTR